jgi:malonyl-CoA O-methyltransferase
MKISTEFSKNAPSYGDNNFIQNIVADKLLSLVKTKPQYILDLGCGSGALCNKIDWNYKKLTGIDFAPGMLELHPKSKKIEAIYGDFNDKTLFENLSTYSYDYVFSASALQWAEDLDTVFKNIKNLNIPVALAIFTSSTFKTLNDTAKIQSMLLDAKEIDTLQKKYFNANVEIVDYKLEFDNVRDMFKYIKDSGVSGSRNILTYKDMKRVMNEYPLNYLEFEVIYIVSS